MSQGTYLRRRGGFHRTCVSQGRIGGCQGRNPCWCCQLLGRGGGQDLEAGGWATGGGTTPVGGTTGRGAAVRTEGAELTLCDRSRREALIGESLLSSAEEVGSVATIDWTVASCVVMVSSGLVMDARALREEQRKGMRLVSPSDRSLSCPLSGMGI